MENKLKYKLASPVLMWAIVIIGGVILWKITPFGLIFSSAMLGAVVLVLGFINWLYVISSAMRVHHKAPASVNNISQLVKEGVYAVVRHPIYAADIVLALCVFVYHPSTQVLAVVAWLALVLLFWANFEERMLEEKFMEDYREYKKRVPMLIPRFTKRKI